MGKSSKVVVIGGKATGKTSILEKAIFANTVDKEYIATIEDTYVAYIDTERGTKEEVRFYDTAGLDGKNRTVPPHLHGIADAYILVYAVNDSNSFHLLNDAKRDIEKNKEKKEVPIVLLGNKMDESQRRVIDTNLGERWASVEKARFWEVTAKNRNTLIEPFVYLASRLCPQPSKGTFHQLSMGRKGKE